MKEREISGFFSGAAELGLPLPPAQAIQSQLGNKISSTINIKILLQHFYHHHQHKYHHILRRSGGPTGKQLLDWREGQMQNFNNFEKIGSRQENGSLDAGRVKKKISWEGVGDGGKKEEEEVGSSETSQDHLQVHLLYYFIFTMLNNQDFFF